jgi:hypothetical protein
MKLQHWRFAAICMMLADVGFVTATTASNATMNH